MFESAIKSYLKKYNYSQFNLKAVLFDMDGVLLDSMNQHSTAWVQAMDDFKIPFSINDTYLNEGRLATATTNNAFISHFDRNATEEELQEIYALKTHYLEALDPIEKMPFAHELLKQLKHQGIKTLLVTGSGQSSLLESLDNHFPGIFQEEQMVTAFDVTHGKPAPEPYLQGLQKSGVQPWEVIVIENAPLGVESAVAAGLFTIAINTGPLDDEILLKSGADVLLKGMNELYHHWGDFPQHTTLSSLS